MASLVRHTKFTFNRRTIVTFVPRPFVLDCSFRLLSFFFKLSPNSDCICIEICHNFEASSSELLKMEPIRTVPKTEMTIR